MQQSREGGEREGFGKPWEGGGGGRDRVEYEATCMWRRGESRRGDGGRER